MDNIPAPVSRRSLFVVPTSSEGFGGRGQPDCVEPNEGYALMASSDDSTIIFIFLLVVISSRHECYLSLQDDLLAEMIETGV